MCRVLRYNGQAGVSHGLQNLLLATILLACVPACFAERADRDKPLFLEADQVLIDDTQQTSNFIGNVRLTQGTMLIRGDKIEVVKYRDSFKQAKAYGNTASFRQKREGSEEYVEGYGERIEYDARSGTVDFYVRARVKRELDEVRGDHITYSMKTETFQVSSSANSIGTPPRRVRAVLQPKPKADASAPPAQDASPIAPSKTPTSPE
jgi:lipopolysaccharide export system protein LptA